MDRGVIEGLNKMDESNSKAVEVYLSPRFSQLMSDDVAAVASCG